MHAILRRTAPMASKPMPSRCQPSIEGDSIEQDRKLAYRAISDGTRRRLALGILAVIFAVNQTFAQSKQDDVTTSQAEQLPWRLSMESRLQLRLNNDRSRLQRLAASGMPSSGLHARADVIVGSRNPELLLPWELHRFLMANAFYSDPDVAAAWRRRIAGQSKSSRITALFWSKLEEVSTDYLRDQSSSREFAARMAGSNASTRDALREQVVAVDSTLCFERMLALRRAYEVFGEEWFVRFLYEAVSPDLTIFSEDPMPAEQHRFVSRGCK